MVDLFAEDGLGTRIHTTWRFWTCPFDRLEPLIGPGDRVLDYGCGHGAFAVYLALSSPGREVDAVDLDADKIDRGARIVEAAGLSGRVRMRHIDAAWRPEPGRYDAVVIADVLYLLGDHGAAVALDAVSAALVPGGRVVVKEMAELPRWKARWSRVQELFAVKILRITRGEVVSPTSESVIVDSLVANGLTVERFPIDRHYVHPHLAFVGTAP